jgi:hypothetical protein
MQTPNIIHYKFFLSGLAEPILIESWSKELALKSLYLKMNHMPNLKGRQLINMSLYKPISGITVKQESGVKYVWLGDFGWVSESEFLELKDQYKNKTL